MPADAREIVEGIVLEINSDEAPLPQRLEASPRSRPNASAPTLDTLTAITPE